MERLLSKLLCDGYFEEQMVLNGMGFSNLYLTMCCGADAKKAQALLNGAPGSTIKLKFRTSAPLQSANDGFDEPVGAAQPKALALLLCSFILRTFPLICAWVCRAEARRSHDNGKTQLRPSPSLRERSWRPTPC